jgi:hypothetical protein
MHFHYCGNPLHDIPMNFIMLLTVFPEWVPWVRQLGTWIKTKPNTTDTCEHSSETLHEHKNSSTQTS